MIPSSQPPEPAIETASPMLLHRRAIATFIDLIICYFVIETIFISIVMMAVPELVEQRTSEIFVGSVLLLGPLYQTYSFSFEWRFARTPGKVRMGVVVATTEGTHPGLVPAAIRNLIRYIDWLPIGYLLGWVIARRSHHGQRIGDYFANTVVVRPRAEINSEYFQSSSLNNKSCGYNDSIPNSQNEIEVAHEDASLRTHTDESDK